MSTRDSTLAARVDKGAELLDAKRPDWYWHVNPGRIEMSEGSYSPELYADAYGTPQRECGCVLAQLHASDGIEGERGYYNVMLRNLGIYDLYGEDYGFTINRGEGLWDELNELWKKAIEARREADDDNSAAWVR